MATIATPSTPGTLTPEHIRETVLRILSEVAPEADLESLDPDVEFRDQLDIDSMDFLSFILGIHHELGVDVPELDYPKMASLGDCVSYLQGALSA